MQWETAEQLIPYPEALTRMEAYVESMRIDKADEMIWLLEHPPIYTAGSSAKRSDIIDARFPVFQTGRGGQVTYHGPGQRVAYCMLDLSKRGRDLRAYAHALEHWIIETLAEFNVEGFTREGRIGVWVDETAERRKHGGEGSSSSEPSAREAARSIGQHDRSAEQPKEAKIAAQGVRVQGWITSHGIAINLNPNLSHYDGIVPCGIRDYGVTSLHALGVKVSMDELDAALKRTFPKIFAIPSATA